MKLVLLRELWRATLQMTIIYGAMIAPAAIASEARERISMDDFEGACRKLVNDIQEAGGRARSWTEDSHRTASYNQCGIWARSGEKIRFGVNVPPRAHLPTTRELYLRSFEESCQILGGEIGSTTFGRNQRTGSTIENYACDTGANYSLLMSFYRSSSPNQYIVTLTEAASDGIADTSAYADLLRERGLHTPQQRQERLAREERAQAHRAREEQAHVRHAAHWEAERSLNGPTGTAETDRGSFTVARFGTLSEPHPLYINGNRPADIAAVEFPGSGGMKVVLRTGEVQDSHWGRLTYRKAPTSYSTYGVHNGFPIVVRDTATGHLREERFPNFWGVRRITFDPPTAWENTLATVISRPSPRPEPSRLQAQAQPEPKALNIGDKVCAVVLDASSREHTGFLIGRPQYRHHDGTATITAFVERVEGDRFQLRNAGVSFRPSSGAAASPVSPFDYAGVQLTPGMLFWDSRGHWRSCQ